MNRKAVVALGGVFVLLLAVMLVWRARVNKWKWEPIPMPDRFARVPQEWSVETLAKRMKESKKLRDPATFEIAAAQANLKRIMPGGYFLPRNAGPKELAETFAKGPSHYSVTFPEGWTVWQMSNRLKKKGYAAAENLRQDAYPSGQPISAIEGTLFPDTYWLRRAADSKEIRTKLHDRYKEITKALPKTTATVDGKPLSLHEITVLASLVERETDVHEERALVAGVLLHRLRIGMRLQCDASVQYAIQMAAWQRGETDHQVVLRSHYKFESPYNTYRNKGLPPGAICNPSKECLIAASRPTETDYLFYVWSPKLKKHRFAKTFEAHKANIALARKEEN